MGTINDIVSRAFHDERNTVSQNSTVRVSMTPAGVKVTRLLLHGYEIARKIGPMVAVNLQGFPTKTTLSRLNSLLMPEVRIWQETGRIYWATKEDPGANILPVSSWTIVKRGSVLEQMANIENEEVIRADGQY